MLLQIELKFHTTVKERKANTILLLSTSLSNYEKIEQILRFNVFRVKKLKEFQLKTLSICCRIILNIFEKFPPT